MTKSMAARDATLRTTATLPRASPSICHRLPSREAHLSGATGFNRTSPNNAQDIPIQLSVNNSFEGGGGDDNITGSAGAQASYSTGNGGTQISYAHALDAVTVDLHAGTAQGTAINDVAHVGHDTFTRVNAVVGS